MVGSWGQSMCMYTGDSGRGRWGCSRRWRHNL